MNYRIVPTPEYEEAQRLGRFQRTPACFGMKGPKQHLHKLAKQNGLTRSFYTIVPVPEPVVMSDPDPRLN